MRCYLSVDSVELVVLVLNFRAHVDGHVAQITDHGAHFAHIVLHLALAGVLSDPVTHRRAFIISTVRFHLFLFGCFLFFSFPSFFFLSFYNRYTTRYGISHEAPSIAS